MQNKATFKILIVCTGNICRSPMAAGMLKASIPDGLKERTMVSSAGLAALHGQQAAEHAIEAMARRGIDIRSHRARQLTAELIRKSDLVLTMEKAQAAQLRRMVIIGRPDTRMISEFGDLSGKPDIADPYGSSLADYLLCAQILEPCIQGLTAWLTRTISQCAT